MYKHHEESIGNMKEYFRKQGAVALILAGSVAKGVERVNGDGRFYKDENAMCVI